MCQEEEELFLSRENFAQYAHADQARQRNVSMFFNFVDTFCGRVATSDTTGLSAPSSRI